MYITTRNNTYYYRRRIPLAIVSLCDSNYIHRPLSSNRILAKQLAVRYNNIFNMIDIGLKLGHDVSNLISELNVKTVEKIDIYEKYLQNQCVNENRLQKINRLLSVLKLLLPVDISKVDMNTLDKIKSILSTIPRRSTQKYRAMDIREVVKIKANIQDRLSVETLNDHLKILNSLLKFAYERDAVAKPYAVSMAKKITNTRDERISLSVDTIRQAVDRANSRELSSSFTLLYLSGLRPSEAFKCTVTTVDGIKCFDLTDRALQLKTKSSYRLIPVHHSIDDPEQILEDYRSMSSQYMGRQFKVEEGTLYSLRHSFATQLASNGVEPHIITELLGHSHGGMTLARYVKGFPVQMLKDAVDTLLFL